MYNKTKILQSNILLRRLYNAHKTYGEEIKSTKSQQFVFFTVI